MVILPQNGHFAMLTNMQPNTQFNGQYKMPLLAYADSLIEPVDWSNVLVIACQHLVESNFLYLKKIIDQGLPPQNLFMIGKAYSTSDAVIEDFNDIGVYVHPSSNQFDSYQSFNQQFHRAIADFFVDIRTKVNFDTFDKILIMDDGAELLLYAHHHIADLSHFAGVEQTSSGFHKLDGLSLKFPIINVARSQAKLVLESPFIAEAVIKNFHQYLQKQSLQPQRILIVGAGYIGNSIYDQLHQHYIVHRYDIEQHKSDFAHAQLHQIQPDYDAVISCVGRTIFTAEDYQYFKPEVILASASSSDIEFSAEQLRKLAPQTNDVHADIRIPGPNGAIHLFNAGFPLNFDGSRQLIPLEKIQLTEALLYTALCLARSKNYPVGITPFDQPIQNQLIERFKQLTQDTSCHGPNPIQHKKSD